MAKWNHVYNSHKMTKEIMVERQESLIPVSEVAYLRGEVNRLREGNAVVLKENAKLREQLANSQTDHYETGHILGAKCQTLSDALAMALQPVRDWYDSKHPPEDGHDQVYPWDQA